MAYAYDLMTLYKDAMIQYDELEAQFFQSLRGNFIKVLMKKNKVLTLFKHLVEPILKIIPKTCLTSKRNPIVT